MKRAARDLISRSLYYFLIREIITINYKKFFFFFIKETYFGINKFLMNHFNMDPIIFRIDFMRVNKLGFIYLYILFINTIYITVTLMTKHFLINLKLGKNIERNCFLKFCNFILCMYFCS